MSTDGSSRSERRGEKLDATRRVLEALATRGDAIHRGVGAAGPSYRLRDAGRAVRAGVFAKLRGEGLIAPSRDALPFGEEAEALSQTWVVTAAGRRWLRFGPPKAGKRRPAPSAGGRSK